MVKLEDRIQAEKSLMEKQLQLMPAPERIPYIDALSLAGVASLLNSLYNGYENILKQILRFHNIALPKGERWHRDLLELSRNENFISSSTYDNLAILGAFRHFFVHAYSSEIYSDKLLDLVCNSHQLFDNFMADIETLVSLPEK